VRVEVTESINLYFRATLQSIIQDTLQLNHFSITATLVSCQHNFAVAILNSRAKRTGLEASENNTESLC
jgi:hypothetical protein